MVCQVCQSAPDHRVDPVDRVQLPSNAVVADSTAVGSRVDDTVDRKSPDSLKEKPVSHAQDVA